MGKINTLIKFLYLICRINNRIDPDDEQSLENIALLLDKLEERLKVKQQKEE